MAESTTINNTISATVSNKDLNVPISSKDSSADLENGAPKKYFESNAGDGSTAVSQHLTGLPLALTIISCVAAIFVAALDITIITTILSKIGNEFDSFNRIGWLSSGFLLPMATLTPSYGKVSIVFGRKNVALAGIAIFEIGSLICALANSMDMLIGGRVIQGIGAGAITSMVSVILTEIVPISKRSLLLMTIGMTFALASVLGPFIGGAFASHTTWRWCFYINLPIGGIAAALLVLFFHPPRPMGQFMDKMKRIDYLGTFLIAAGLVLILLALTFGGVEFPWKSAAVICCFILGGFLLVAFSIWNFKFSKNPILIKELVTSPKILASCLSATFSYSIFVVLLTYLASYFQIIYQASAWTSGIRLLPCLIAVTISSVSSGIIIKKTKMVKPVLMASAILGPVGVGLLLLLGVDSLEGKKIGCLIPVGVLIGLMFQPSLIASQLLAPSSIEGSIILVTVLLNFFRAIFASIAVTMAQLIFQTAGLKNINSLYQSLPKDSASYKTLSKYTAIELISSPEIIQAFDSTTKNLVLKEVMKSFTYIFYFCLGLSSLTIVCGVFVTNKRVPDEVATKEENEEEVEEADKAISAGEEEEEHKEKSSRDSTLSLEAEGVKNK